jgi:hypothetical protein
LHQISKIIYGDINRAASKQTQSAFTTHRCLTESARWQAVQTGTMGTGDNHDGTLISFLMIWGLSAEHQGTKRGSEKQKTPQKRGL